MSGAGPTPEAETPIGPPQERPVRPRFAVSASTTYATSVAVAIVSLINVLITARYLGPTGRGEVAFVTSIAGVTSTVALIGVEQANVNMAGTDPGVRRALASNSLLLAAVLGIGGAAFVALLVAIAPGIRGSLPTTLMWLALLAIPLLVARTYLGTLLEGDYRFVVSNAARMLSPLAGVVVNGALAIAGALSATTASVTWVAAQTLGLGLLVWFIARRSVGFGRPDAAVARRSLRFGAKAHVGRVLNLGNYRLDQWFVGAMAGTRELGLYSVAVAWSEMLFFLPTALASVQRPDIVRATRAGAARRASAVFRIAVLLTAPATLVLVAAAPVLCTWVFGEGFSGSIDDLRVLSLGAFGVIAVKLLGDALTAQRRPLLSSAAIGSGFVCTLTLDLLLIPSLGGLGAAIASTVSYSVGGVAAATLFLRALGGSAGDLRPRRSDVGAVVAVARRVAQRR